MMILAFVKADTPNHQYGSVTFSWTDTVLVSEGLLNGTSHDSKL